MQDNQNNLAQQRKLESDVPHDFKVPPTVHTITNPLSNPDIMLLATRSNSNDSEPNGFNLANGTSLLRKKRSSNSNSCEDNLGRVVLPMHEHTALPGLTGDTDERHCQPHKLILRKESVA